MIDLHLYAMAFLASATYVGLKAFQQLNVVHEKWAWVIQISFLMQVCEVFLVVQVSRAGFGWIVLATGAGSAVGCVVAMLIHRRLRGASKE